MATIFAPQVRPVQPAFINNGGGVKVYFSLSSFNSINEIGAVKYSLVDPNIVSTWGSNLKSEGEISASAINTEGDEYYITIPTTGLSLASNQFYQIQLWLKDKSNSSNVSDPSQASLIRPILEHSIKGLPNSGPVYELGFFSGRIEETGRVDKDAIESLAAISCTVGNYTYNGKCDGSYFTIDMNDYPFTEGAEAGTSYNLIFKYETIYGYKGQVNRNYNLKKPGVWNSPPSFTMHPDPAAATINFEYDSSDYQNCFVERASEEKGWNTWEKIGKLTESTRGPGNPWRDSTIQSEMNYRYRISKGNASNKVSTPELTHIVTVNGQDQLSNNVNIPFDNIIISDKDFLFNLKYNTNISGFKYITQEAIINTLGGKYPLIRRNGDTDYIQFSLSGLLYVDCTKLNVNSIDSIGRDLDTMQDIIDEEVSLFINPNNSINLINFNNKAFAEKKVREILMRFLANGKPKLFRSFEEGNMIVYLSGVSFTPNKQLGRHIYDFSATVTQLCDCTFENLSKYGLNQNSYTDFVKALSPAEDIVNNGVFYTGKVTVKQGEEE